jgi:ABC-type uncharacterized transport system ATPase component
MKQSAQQMMDRLNTKMIEHNQLTRVIAYSGKSITLSTGEILLDKDKDKF